jgi:hypothetical protein
MGSFKNLRRRVGALGRRSFFKPTRKNGTFGIVLRISLFHWTLAMLALQVHVLGQIWALTRPIGELTLASSLML